MRIPSSTYRLQIRSSFTLDDAAALTDYLADLGVGAVYLSPILTATAGSDHGYDVTDPTAIDPERGGEQGWTAFLAAARAHDLQVVVDIVPNHLGISVPRQNPSWWSVLKHGQDSPYAAWYDIDWNRAPILVPILGDGATAADLRIEEDPDEGHVVRYYEHLFPLAEGSYSPGDDIGDVLGRQHYRFSSFRVANTDLNYRRFFAVTTLAGVRVEDRDVFAATHERVLRWVREDGVEGLRIDHPDGLVDPAEYQQRLADAAPDTWIVVEKILEHGERLPDWPVAGTSGYDAMTEVSQIFVDPSAEEFFTDLYVRLTGDERDMTEHMLLGKRQAATELLPAEVGRLAALVAATHPELDAESVRAALVDVAARMEVYRSYLPFGVDYLDEAMGAAVEADDSLGEVLGPISGRLHDPADELARRFQQLSGAVMAKGVEDTAYYRHARFIALNEVGGNPMRFGTDLDTFHEAMIVRQRDMPASMTALSTHDTKRGEDVRARLAVLAEIGPAWADFAEEFVATSGIENRAFAYFMAQTLVGVGPVSADRLYAYAEKAMREANDGTGWTSVNEQYERSVTDCVAAWLSDPDRRERWDAFDELIDAAARSNSLGAKLVQLAMPGVPDVYQGTELLEDSLVDPDNRRPVDFVARRALLTMDEPPAIDGSGRVKFWVVRKTLQLRRSRPEMFTGYQPVRAEGSAADHVIAFDRGGVVAVATRLPVALTRDGWGDTVLPLEGEWADELTGARFSGPVRLDELLVAYPVALLVRG